MLTRNFYKFAMANMANASFSKGYTDYEGNSLSTYPSTTAYPLTAIHELNRTVSDTTYGVHIGSGTTAPSGDDYNLEAPITSGFSVVKPSSGAVSAEDDCIKWSATYAITNTGTAPLTICEIGLFGKGHSTQTAAYRCLYDRTVLEAPIVIEPGQCKMVTYTIQFDYPK